MNFKAIEIQVFYLRGGVSTAASVHLGRLFPRGRQQDEKEPCQGQSDLCQPAGFLRIDVKGILIKFLTNCMVMYKETAFWNASIRFSFPVTLFFFYSLKLVKPISLFQFPGPAPLSINCNSLNLISVT